MSADTYAGIGLGVIAFTMFVVAIALSLGGRDDEDDPYDD